MKAAESAVVASLMGGQDPRRAFGYPATSQTDEDALKLVRAKIDVALVAQGFVPPDGTTSFEEAVTRDVLWRYREQSRQLQATVTTTVPIVARVQRFLDTHLADCCTTTVPHLPRHVLVLAEHGLARELSFPPGAQSFASETLSSFRVAQGVLHNPKSDKRTTANSFHIAEGSTLPISADKLRVPKAVFATMLCEALSPPAGASLLPYTAKSKNAVHCMVQLMLRPEVSPEIPGRRLRQTMETLCLAPGTLVSCLDYLESIFGNAGDPFLPDNDAALDTEHWTGHTGCIVVAPHLTKKTKKELGLPRWEDATELQRVQGMCWKSESELYNGGNAFKLCCRSEAGVIVTIIADNYFGYMKKEVKTQLSYACNLAGLAEEEHSGGTLALPQYSYGLTHDAAAEAQRWSHLSGFHFTEAMKLLGDAVDIRPEGYAVDRNFSHIIYVPEDAFFSLERNTVTFNKGASSLRLLPGTSYVLPSGFKLSVRHHPAAPAWRLIGTEGRGAVIHKPTTVSGGGKSELSKAIDGAMIFGALFVGDPEEEFALVDELLNHDYSTRFRDPSRSDTRPLLAESRSLGSVIKLLTPSEVDYTDEYNIFLHRFPDHVLPIVFYVKRFYKPSWGTDWRSHFSTDLINGTHGHELKFENRRILAGYLRVGTTPGGLWRTFKTRIDFVPASKVQLEDDISSAVTVPAAWLPPASVPQRSTATSFKLAHNCEFRLFQRPDDCIRRGADAQCEYDLAQDGSFIANFEPLHPKDIRDVVEDVSGLEQFTPPMRTFLTRTATMPEDHYVVCSDRTRLVAGKPTANPRYLQTRPDAVDTEATYLAEVGMRLSQRVPAGQPVCSPVDVTLLGRRISKPGPQLPNLAVYNPLHFMELPELMADLFCCVSGTSPSTTGAGSEGPLTKGPFNALPFPIDLNNAFVSYALTGLGGWSTPTGNIGPQLSFSHDVSFISPELFSRMKPFERDPKWLEANGYLERMADFEFEGRKVLASRLGLRITDKFVHFLGRVFEVPSVVFDRSILRPEIQSPAGFADGVDSIVLVQKVLAQRYFEDGTIDMLCPPLRALCHIMAKGIFQGKDFSDPNFRAMFTREAVLGSAWYRERLETQQKRDIALWQRHIDALQQFIASPNSAEPVKRLALVSRLENARRMLTDVTSPAYIDSLIGTIGADPLFPKCK